MWPVGCTKQGVRFIGKPESSEGRREVCGRAESRAAVGEGGHVAQDVALYDSDPDGPQRRAVLRAFADVTAENLLLRRAAMGRHDDEGPVRTLRLRGGVC